MSRSIRLEVVVSCIAGGVLVGCTGGCGDDGTTGAGGSTASSSSASAPSTGGAGGALPTGLAAHVTSTRFVTADHMLASVEMQISGEPFAELLGRDLGGYDRFSADTDMYLDPDTGRLVRDGLGWSFAIESYEYSKQPMNALSFESGAGLSLMFGPLVNPTGVTGDPAYASLLARLQALALASRASGALVGKDFVAVPPPMNDPDNAYGWAGFWPVFAEFRSFDPTIHPSVGADQQCSLAGATDEPIPPGTVLTYVGDYECDARTLNLVDRDAQVEKIIEPAALGFTAWKQGLWAINYWGSMHDVDQHPIVVVPAADLPQVGATDNDVIGQWPSPLDPTGMELVFGKDGTYFGDVSLEGWQGLVMIDELDEKSTFLLARDMTADGVALAGVPSVGQAVDYDFVAPLRWWPAAVSVTETVTAPTPAEARKYFPAPTTFTISDGSSRLEDLTALLGGFSQLYAMTDASNPDVGGTQAFLGTFDGTPFAGDDQLPDGEDSAHDRALGILKIALVDLDRIHLDAAHGVLVGTATIDGSGNVTRGSHVSTFDTSYSILGLRTAYRSLTGSLTLYSNDTPDALGAPSALDATQLDGAPFADPLGAHVVTLVTKQADFLSDHLIDADGTAVEGFDLASGTPDAAPGSLEAQASAIRGLLEAYLATSDAKYRTRAEQAYAVLESRFWMADVRAYRTSSADSMKMTYTPRALGALTGALRQFYKLVASQPGKEALAVEVLDRLGRTMKLVVNGWNDTNGDGIVQPEECMGGRLQLAERALTGEFSIAADAGDRDHDCVPDIATAKVSASLAAELVVERQ